MKTEDIFNKLNTDKNLSDFIKEIETSSDIEQCIVAALFALNYKLEQLDAVVTHILSKTNEEEISKDMNNMVHALQESTQTLNNAITKLSNQ